MKLGIAAKIIAITALFMIVAVVFLGWRFAQYQIHEVNENLSRVGEIIVKNTAENCEWPMLAADIKTLQQVADNLRKKEKDVIYIRIASTENKTIVTSGMSLNEKVSTFMSDIVTTTQPASLEQIMQISSARINDDKFKVIGNITIVMSQKSVLKKIASIHNQTNVVMAAIILILMVAIFSIIYFFITRPLVPLVRGISKIATGDFKVQIPIKSSDEMGRLAQAFNAMTQALSATHVSRDHLNRIIQLMFNGLIVTDQVGNITMANNATLELLGYGESELSGKPIGFLFEKDKINAENISTMRNVELECISKARHLIPVIFSASNMHDNAGESQGWICVVQDITERKYNEIKVQNAAHELERSNKELEQFAYVISHDLKEPLRMVSSYVLLLKKRYENKLDGDANEFINYAMDGALRMADLIDALLTYARVGTTSKNCVVINCEEMLTDILSNLSLTIKDKNAIINHGAMPAIVSDKILLSQVIQNLVSNGLKFNKSLPPIVDINITEDNNNWMFSVRDNGIGVDARYMERIFIMFKRLHSREEYPGTGIGLALCKKIIASLGGSIWLESQVGIGTCFYFTLPKKEEK